ncbi:ATPase [Bacteroidia bacterium]|nr:ATPase [Bacteroidia bacterium]GHT03410.1 ATPase [Bacteroidia bacterium]GHT45135.1 ATPase [Bacteroidia bacterium]GHT88781.1 ATPase [Bacteroidia bacterium]
MINRVLEKTVEKRIGKGKAIILMGPRQVGKTTLIKSLFPNNEDTLWLNGDDPDVNLLFENMSATRLQSIIGNKKLVVIDEAQRISDIGVRLKLITDQMPEVQLIATGSSSFDLANKINEPLTGRKWEYKMFPVSFEEMTSQHGFLEEKRLIPHRLIYGYYPEVVTHPGEEKDVLKQLSDSYLYKDILIWEQIKKSDKLLKLLQALAYQVGCQVSYAEIGQLCGLDYKTVEKYIGLLEQTFVIFRLPSFNRNLRNELRSSRKVYFVDNGIRNALIADFRQIELRNDVGALWENFLISERIKKLNYHQIWANSWFWRTQQQKEIDYLEEKDGTIAAYEFKWNPGTKYKYPKQFAEAYPNSTFEVIHRENFEEFI